jgi:hypothetical protein
MLRPHRPTQRTAREQRPRELQPGRYRPLGHHSLWCSVSSALPVTLGAKTTHVSRACRFRRLEDAYRNSPSGKPRWCPHLIDWLTVRNVLLLRKSGKRRTFCRMSASAAPCGPGRGHQRPMGPLWTHADCVRRLVILLPAKPAAACLQSGGAEWYEPFVHTFGAPMARWRLRRRAPLVHLYAGAPTVCTRPVSPVGRSWGGSGPSEVGEEIIW